MSDQYEPLEIQKITFHRKKFDLDVMELINTGRPPSSTCILAEYLKSKHDNIVLSEMEKMGFTYNFIQENALDFSRYVFDGNDHEIFTYNQRPFLEIMWTFPLGDYENQTKFNVEFYTRTFEPKKD